MSKTRQTRTIPTFEALPRPLYARTEQWGEQGSQTYWHSHDWCQLSYALTGVLSVNTEQGRFVAPPQFAVWLPAHCRHQVISVSAAQMRSLYVADGQLLQAQWQQPVVCEITPLVRELIVHFCNSDPAYQRHSPEARLAKVLLDQLAQLPRASLQLPLPADHRLQRLCDHLQQDPAHNEPLERLAQHIGLSSRSVSRLFKQQTGLTFRQWRLRLRLFQALEALRDGQRVTRVAVDCGYDSLSAFVAAFRSQFGRTPGQYFNNR